MNEIANKGNNKPASYQFCMANMEYARSLFIHQLNLTRAINFFLFVDIYVEMFLFLTSPNGFFSQKFKNNLVGDSSELR